MASRRKRGGASSAATSSTSEVVQFRSPAEFFAENQNIAGFDNPGKSLYTTIRELVENSLDAAECIHKLPEITVTINELSSAEFNKIRGLANVKRTDVDLFKARGKGSKKKRKSAGGDDNGSAVSATQSTATTGGAGGGAGAGAGASKEASSSSGRGRTTYFKITCTDNGVGMPHDAIPDMFGRVLAGSKYGVRQTRGKFGLGAKMALIWSKKSTGMPVEIRSCHSPKASKAGPSVTYCKLDIDIYKNVPRVIKHTKIDNKFGFRGSEVTVYIGGNWTTYRSRVINYLRQLAIITPYARLSLQYSNSSSPSKDFSVQYEPRSTQMPPVAKEVKHHPKSVNNLLVKQLLDRKPHHSIQQFLHTQFSCVSKALAKRIVAELGPEFEDATCSGLSPAKVHALTALLREASFPPLDGSCLSPAGEYNLRLGIMKELEPLEVATHRSEVAGFEGHPFIVEAGVSLGGKEKREGITVHRFANRIPLLFEAGGDVATKTANAINWGRYKIDKHHDKIGVFVSIVSTKIPFKGTGKEYIGSDIVELATAVKKALQACCLQLKQFVTRRNAEKTRNSRKKMLYKYVPDVARAVEGVLKEALKRTDQPAPRSGRGRGRGSAAASAAAAGNESATSSLGGSGGTEEVVKADDATLVATATARAFARAQKRRRMLERVDGGEVTASILEERLRQGVDRDHAGVLEQLARDTGRAAQSDVTCFITPLLPSAEHLIGDVVAHPCCVIRLFPNCGVQLPAQKDAATSSSAGLSNDVVAVRAVRAGARRSGGGAIDLT